MKVYKYEMFDKVGMFGNCPIQMHPGRILKVDAQRDIVCIWALVDPEAPVTLRQFYLAATGLTVPKGATYIGTAQLYRGSVVVHVFELATQAGGAE
jgi:hypothetical protein